jgi:hypothetical protein
MPEPDGLCGLERCMETGTVSAGSSHRLCDPHAGLVWEAVENRDARQLDVLVPGSEWREYVRAEARAKRSVERRKPASIGQIYFVRIGELIKVGWTTKLADRVTGHTGRPPSCWSTTQAAAQTRPLCIVN